MYRKPTALHSSENTHNWRFNFGPTRAGLRVFVAEISSSSSFHFIVIIPFYISSIKSQDMSFKRKMFMIAGACAVVTLIILAVVWWIEVPSENKCKNVITGSSEEWRKDIPTNSTKDNIGDGIVLRIVPRDGWLAQPPLNPLVPLDLPVKRVIIIPTLTTNCETQAACTFTVRNIQTFNIESQQQDDIIYNFLIGGDGNVYEGRGWDNRGSFVNAYNDDSISVAYIGSFKKQKPSGKQLNVTRLLLAEGVRMDKLSEDYRIVGTNKLDATLTATSADALYESLKDWPHWSDH
ncbi:peptidoglycan-recognition protein LC-like isoform X3 [Musca autumnalis]|uniref:peptidoglycan-recognition protein LC-like isoform X3 n=1 Tax=Musca autumnalis TaxID=221902 RepID=UPI003CF883B1